jgi:hypothetical protein
LLSAATKFLWFTASAGAQQIATSSFHNCFQGFVLTLSCNNGDGGSGLAVAAVLKVSHNLHVLIRGLVSHTGNDPV